MYGPSSMRNLIRLFLLISVAVPGPSFAQDKSGSRSGLMKVPEAGGTVTSESGSFRISSNKGASQYSLPLPTLPSRAGVGPSVALQYSQFAGDAGQGFGIGWSLSVPSISVSTDQGLPLAGSEASGEISAYLSFEGQKLVFVRSQGDKLIYRLKAHEDSIQVVYHKNLYAPTHARALDTGAPEITSGFELVYPDGRRQLYSGDLTAAEGREGLVTRYPLSYEIAPFGETIAYRYTKIGGRSYLTDISYAGGKSRIQFELIDGLNHLKTYAMGYPQESPKLYAKLRASFDGKVQSQWCFAYLGRSSDKRSDFSVKAHPDCIERATSDITPQIDRNSLTVLDELRMIYRYGEDQTLSAGTKQEAPLGFDYSSWSQNKLAKRELVYQIPGLVEGAGFSVKNYELSDINHDGLVDAIRKSANGNSDIYMSSGELKGLFKEPQFWTLNRGNLAISPNLSSDDFHFADLNGDSLVDLIQFENGLSYIYLGQPNGGFNWSGSAVKMTPDQLGPSNFARGKTQFHDVNGDGLSDILTTDNSTGENVWKVYVNTSFKNDEQWTFRFFQKTYKFPFPTSGLNLADPNFRLTDINGDQLPDVAYLRSSPEDNQSGLCVYLNQGQLNQKGGENLLLFGEEGLKSSRCGDGGRLILLQGLRGQPNLHGLWLVDVNGDGITDVSTIGDSNQDLLVWLGFGDSSLSEDPIRLRLNLPLSISNASEASKSRIADIDGDGQLEILVFDESAEGSNKALMIDFNRLSDRQLVKSNLLTTVAFASGLRYDIRYATSTTERLRDQRLGKEVSNLHFPVVVAKQVISSQGVPSLSRRSVKVEEYFYHKPFYDSEDKEFLGFSEVEVLNYGDNYAEESSLSLESYYTYAPSPAARKLAGKLKEKRIYSVAEDPYFTKQAELTNVFDPLDAATHSWLDQSQSQSLPLPRQLVSQESFTWVAPSSGVNTYFLRLEEESKTLYDDEEGPAGPSPYRKTVSYGEFDIYNIPHKKTEQLRSLEGPRQVFLPDISTVSSVEYDDARARLGHLGVISLPDYQIVERNGELLSYKKFAYDYRSLLIEETAYVESRLQEAIPTLASERLKSFERTSYFGHDVFGNLTSLTDAYGTVEKLSYDRDGIFPVRRLVPKAHPASDDLVWNFEYKDGRLDSFFSPTGLQTKLVYDQLGRRERLFSSDGAEQRYEYRLGVEGHPSMILTKTRRYREAESPDAGETVWIARLAAYRPDGTLIAEIEDASEGLSGNKKGIRVRNYTAYDRNKRKIFDWTPFSIFEGSPSAESVFSSSESIPTPKDTVGTRTRYDFLGRKKEETLPSGLRVSYSYPPWGESQTQTYLRRGEIQSVKQSKIAHDLGVYAVIEEDLQSGEAHITRFERDNLGNLSSIRLPGEKTARRLTYDNRGLLEYQEIEGLGRYYYAYDIRDRLSTTVKVASDGTKSHKIENSYDTQNRLTAQILDGDLVLSNTYDFYPEPLETEGAYRRRISKPLGLLTASKSFDPERNLFEYVEKLAYADNGAVVHREVKIAGKTYAESYRHLLDGTIKAVKNPMQMEGLYSSDEAGLLRSVKLRLAGENNWQSIIEGVNYNAKGQIEEVLYRSLPSSESRTRIAYDPQTLFLKEVKSSYRKGSETEALQDLSLNVDEHANILEIKDRIEQSPFGLVNRSARFDYNWKSELTQASRYGRTLNYAYSPLGSFTLNEEHGPRAIVPHPASPLIPGAPAGENYSFDGFGQLTQNKSIKDAKYNALGQLVYLETDKYRSYFGYNGAGERVYKKVVEKTTDTLMESIYPLHSMSVEPRGAQSYLFVGDSRLVRLEEDTGQWYYYLKDHLGSSDIVMHSSGRPVEQMLYQPYGSEEDPRKLSSNWKAHQGASSQIAPQEKTHHRFTGHYLDEDSGLYYMNARYYDPMLGRFVQPDPLFLSKPEACMESPAECNLYSYAKNNPLKYTDPTGQWAFLGIFAGAIAMDFVFNPSPANAPGADGKIDTSMPPETKLGLVIAATSLTRSAINGLKNLPSSVKSLLSRPFLPGNQTGAIEISSSRARLPDSALVCRGGTCSADKFANGSGVLTDASGRLKGVSVNSAAGKSLEELTTSIPHNKVGVTTVGEVRKAGGDVISSPTKSNPNHATLEGITPQQAQELMTPTVRNPNFR